MKRKWFWLMLVAVLLLPLLFAHAQESVDDQGNPNDPAVNPRANACYAGASMDGKCHEEIDWIAGWYLIRFEDGIISRDQVPDFVQWVLPGLSGTSPTTNDEPAPASTPQL